MKTGDRVQVLNYYQILSKREDWEKEWQYWGCKGVIIEPKYAGHYRIRIEFGTSHAIVSAHEDTVELDKEYYRDIKLDKLGI